VCKLESGLSGNLFRASYLKYQHETIGKKTIAGKCSAKELLLPKWHKTKYFKLIYSYPLAKQHAELLKAASE